MTGLQRRKYTKIVTQNVNVNGEINKHKRSQDSQRESTQYTYCGFIVYSIAVKAMI